MIVAENMIAVPSMEFVGLSRLLSRLDPDSARAAEEYQSLRRALEKFFDWRGAWPPEECADETLDRLGAKLESDVEIHDVRSYAYGIARLVLFEWHRRPAVVSIDDHPRAARLAAPAPEADEDDPVEECFTRCLAQLPADGRSLVLHYYLSERRAKINNRRRLAQTCGITESALRNRVQRLRDRLERCVHSCINARATVLTNRRSEDDPLS